MYITRSAGPSSNIALVSFVASSGFGVPALGFGAWVFIGSLCC